MKILLLGASGQLGWELQRALAPLGEVLAPGRAQGADLAEPERLEALARALAPDAIVNAAAYTAVDKAEQEPAAAFALNRDGARMLAAAAARRGAAIIHISTDYVFDGRKGAAYVEGDATGPVNVYGRSKLEGETVVRAENPRHVIVRTSWVHSAGGQNFVRSMLRRAASETELRVVDDQWGSPTYAPHLAVAILAIARRAAEGMDAALWGTYHLAGLGRATWYSLAREVFAASARLGGPTATVVPIASAEYPTVASRPASAGLDCTRIASTLGITLPPWQAGVADCVARMTAALPRQP